MTQERANVRKVTVTINEDGQRLDNFLLKQLPGVPKSHVYRLVRSGQVRINSGRAKPGIRLEEGDIVRIPPVRMAEKGEVVRPPDSVLERLRAAIIQEDEHYLVLDKPSGLAVHAGSGLMFGVIEAIRAWGTHDYIELCHRLDRETSGVLLLAKSRLALLRAQNAFRAGTVDKRYLALLVGKWEGGEREVDAALIKTRQKGAHKVEIADEDEGRDARSLFSPKRLFHGASLCEVKIYSGRMHQIRVHAAALGHAVAGDGKYGHSNDFKSLREMGLKRMFLHAEKLNLAAADGFPPINLQAPLPNELSDVIKALERKRG